VHVNVAFSNSYMGAVISLLQSEHAASVLRWWIAAGVDVNIDETPRHWLAAQAVEAPSHQRRPVAPPVVIQHAPEVPVFDTVTALTAWMMAAELLAEAGPPHRRVSPSGAPQSDLMIMADCPDLADADAGHLLAEPLAPLFDAMLKALGRDRQTVYLASLSPGRPPSGRISADFAGILAPIAKRHVELVAPRQLWLLGDAASRAVLGLSDVKAHGKLHYINVNNVKIAVVVTAHPRFLTTKDQKGRAWGEMKRLIAKENM
jgi:uracil-DNA glycosylase